MFIRMQTQWVVTGMGAIVGLNYQSLEFLLSVYRPKKARRGIIEDIQEIERGALSALARKQAKEADSHGN